MSFLDDAIGKIDALLAKMEADAKAAVAPAPAATPAAPAAAAAPKKGQKAPAEGGDAKDKGGKKKEKKEKKGGGGEGKKGGGKPWVKEEKAKAAPVPPDEEFFAKAKLFVSKVLEVDTLENSDKLYKVKIDCGGGETRQVIAGLRKFVPIEEMKDRLVVTILNLKPAKLAGELSEAMILAGSSPDHTIVCPVLPPEGSAPGDQVYISTPHSAQPKAMKSDHWKKVAEKLKVQDGKACHDGKPLITAKGGLTLPSQVPTGGNIS